MDNYAKIFWFTTLHTKLWYKFDNSVIRFDDVDRYIIVYDGFSYLA